MQGRLLLFEIILSSKAACLVGLKIISNRLPRETLQCLFLEAFKACLNVILGRLLWVTLLKQECWTR